ncbi:unnamed protein product [Arctia plantaginis]|uniref:Uncharacterized protein n=1 Tax=Arctia plantaginis TaxID=874455 RepID=A0A8S0ZUX9_ARCPL|nr:unnamed protein product [Arctia plantaginis]
MNNQNNTYIAKPYLTCLTFWILALDHDLRLVRGELAYVALKDPAGTKVAIWDQLSMDEGVLKLNAILATGAHSGTWRIEAKCGGGTARVDITVGTGLGSTAPAAPAAEQHYVELRFADSMRRRYKPGLPFVGRVEAMSTEKRVRVRVKLYDDKTDIYSQDIDMSTGEGVFIVPTVMADAPYVNLQASETTTKDCYEAFLSFCGIYDKYIRIEIVKVESERVLITLELLYCSD